MTSRGQVVTRLQYQVRNHLKQYLAVRLPKGAELWSAFVAGAPVKPTVGENGLFRIPLAKSQIQGQGQEGFTVELVYYQAATRFMPLGWKQLAFSIPDAPVSRVYWSLYLPEKYRFAHFGGDMEKGLSAHSLRAVFRGAFVDAKDEEKSGSKTVRAKKEDFSYLGKVMGRLNSRQAEGQLITDQIAPEERSDYDAPASRQMALESNVLQNKPQQLATGVFPIAFDVPATGQLFRFGQVMVVGEAPRVSMTYFHAGFLYAFYWLLLAGFAALVWRFRTALIAVMRDQILPRLRAWQPVRTQA
jgi:hypothetical protein